MSRGARKGLSSTAIHLKSIGWKQHSGRDDSTFPFSIPVIQQLDRMPFTEPVTCFVGENGSGKSTLIEAIALAAGLPTVGSTELVQDATLAAQKRLAAQLKLTWTQPTHRGFFLRAEDFFGFQKRLAAQQEEMRQRLAEVDAEYQDRSEYSRVLAKGPAHASLGEIERRYGSEPDARSHGEAFLKLFQARFVPGGLYLLDEPEAALSPQSQIGLLAVLLSMVDQAAQFIIATHSPILLAYPGATIYSFDTLPAGQARYQDLDHVRLTREFLRDPSRFVSRLRAQS